MRSNKKNIKKQADKIILLVILLLSGFLLFYRLNDLMPFFGDEAWFYISARDMLLTGHIPLLGIASSHPWLHQGAFWTYLLGGIFALSHFHPLAPGYFTATLGLITVAVIYLVGKRMFSPDVGLIAAFLYATSPLVIINAREPYHTSLIPIFVLVFIYALYKWLSGKIIYFPMIIFLVACLYNFEIATIPFTLIIMAVLFFGIWKKKKFTRLLVTKKIFFLSFFAWFIPMTSMLLYDRTHGFPQTVKFVLWLGYRCARLFGYPDIHNDTIFTPLAPFLPFTFMQIQHLIFLQEQLVAVVLFTFVFVCLSVWIYRLAKDKEINTALMTLYLCFIIPFLTYLIFHTSSDAYWPMFFPATMFAFAYVIERLLFKRRRAVLGIVIVLLIGGLNAYSLVTNNYLVTGYLFKERLHVARQIITQANGQKYTIIGEGNGSEFESFTMPYAYLTWWLGDGPTEKTRKIKILVSETNNSIRVTKND